MAEISELKPIGLSKDKMISAWKDHKAERRESSKQEIAALGEQAVETVLAVTGRKYSPEVARQVLRTNAEVVYKTLMAKHPEENLLFKPSEEEANEFFEIFTGRKNSKARVESLTIMTNAMVRVYSTFRNQYENRFACTNKHLDVIREGSGECFFKRISPAQLISFWVGEAPKFTKMKDLPLKFICWSSNIETAYSMLPLPWEPDYQERNFKPREKPKRTPVPKGGADVTRDMMSAFGKEDELDPRIRPGLAAAGIDVSQYNDKFLATYQATGKSYAHRPGFLSSTAAPIVKWIARNIYGLRD